MSRILITDGGKHGPEKWAECAADDIMTIGAEAPEALMREATVLRTRLIECFTRHIGHAMEHEQDAIANDGKSVHAEPHVPVCVDEVCALAHDTSFEQHFARPEVRQHVANVCYRFFASAMHVERQWHESLHEPQAAKE